MSTDERLNWLLSKQMTNHYILNNVANKQYLNTCMSKGVVSIEVEYLHNNSTIDLVIWKKTYHSVIGMNVLGTHPVIVASCKHFSLPIAMPVIDWARSKHNVQTWFLSPHGPNQVVNQHSINYEIKPKSTVLTVPSIHSGQPKYWNCGVSLHYMTTVAT
jgi:hypothetical protein